ncbi:hypothetical protein CAEBREN_12446 [Caenorhabditis brenneri]|uniref:MADF domain-containing protein n=2 Tax=Caenorhabditis brenneri TaxID=135651 RepID=G0MZN9_CAEBE|nr:hypothetical protein CAEBREN_12446 [Caenorhabditis brenneri]
MSIVFNFSKRSMDIIKQERLEESRSRHVFPIPDRKPKDIITVKQFKHMELAQASRKAPESFQMRKIILGLLKDRPELWKSVRKINEEEWRKLGMELYRRTGQIVNVYQLIDTFRKAKANLNHRISRCAKAGIGLIESEAILSQWAFFPHIRFFYEYRLENRHFEDEDDDEIEFLGIQAPDNQVEDVDLTLHASIDALHKNLLSSAVAPENTPENNVTPYDSVSHQGYIEEPEESSYFLNPVIRNRKRRLDVSTEVDVEQISYQLHRVFTQYPEKESLIRKAMFSTIFEFDDGNFQDLGQMFANLAAKHSTSEQKFHV